MNCSEWMIEKGTINAKCEADDEMWENCFAIHKALGEGMYFASVKRRENTSMLNAFKIAKEHGDSHAENLLDDFASGKINGIHDWGNAKHRWFRAADGKLYWQTGEMDLKHFVGKIDSNGMPMYTYDIINKKNKRKLAGKSKAQKRKHILGVLKAHGLSETTEVMLASSKTLSKARFRFMREPSFRLIKTFPHHWGLRKNYRNVPVTSLCNTNNTRDAYTFDTPIFIDANFRFTRSVSKGEGKILMTFPRDYKFHCTLANPAVFDEENIRGNKYVCKDDEKENDLTSFNPYPTIENQCFGDAVPPLIAMRAGLEIMRNSKSKGKKKMYLVDIFCSCGGMSCGLVLSGGFDVLCAIDMDREKLILYGRNFPSCLIVNRELKLLDLEYKNTDEDYFRNVEFLNGKVEKKYNDIAKQIVDLAYTKDGRESQWKRIVRGDMKYDGTPIHLHGSPVCVDLSSLGNNRKDSGKSQNTLQWFTGFYRHCETMGIFSSLSLEEARRNTIRDKNKQKLALVQRATIDWVLGAKQIESGDPFDPNSVYWANVDYEKAGMPCSGKRMFVAKGWDPRNLERWSDEGSMEAFNKSLLEDMQDLKLVGGETTIVISVRQALDKSITVQEAILSLPVEDRVPFLLHKAYQFTAEERRSVGKYTENSFWLDEIPSDQLSRRGSIAYKEKRREIVRQYAEKGLLTSSGMAWALTRKGYARRGQGGTEMTTSMNKITNYFQQKGNTASAVVAMRYLRALHGNPNDLAMLVKSITDSESVRSASDAERRRAEAASKLNRAVLNMVPGALDLLRDVQSYKNLFLNKKTYLKYHSDRGNGDVSKLQLLKELRDA